METESSINILIAEDNDVSRELMSGILRAQGYRIYGAVDGESAIHVVEERNIDLCIVDINMSPKGGFEFVKYLLVKGLKIPVILVTAEQSSNILLEATSLGVERLLQKPVTPDRLIEIVRRMLKQRGLETKPLAVETRESKFLPEQLMQKAIELADRNAKTRHGGPFGAIITDKDGKIVSEGVNGISSRVDPTAHAEVMAIRKAADRLGKADLSECILYCSSAPTMMGQALIASVGIHTVYYGLSHDEISAVREQKPRPETSYKQLGHDQALAMFKSWQEQKEKVAD